MIFLSKTFLPIRSYLVISCLILLGCNGYQYVATPYYVPVNIDSSRLNINFSTNNYQLGYAFKNISIFTTGYFRNNRAIFRETALTKENGGAHVQTDKHYAFDIGATYYKTMNELLSYELVAGTGFGTVKYENWQDFMSDYEFNLSAKRYNLYFQPNLSIRESEFDVSFFSRISYNNYFDIHSHWKLGEKGDLEDYDEYFSNRKSGSLFFIEPGLQFRFAFENVKLLWSYSYCQRILGQEMRQRYHSVHLGVSLHFGMKRNRIK